MSLSKQGRAVDEILLKKIVSLWMSGESIVSISKQLDIPYRMILNITDLLTHTGSTKAKQGGNHTQKTCTDKTIEYVTYLKHGKPPIYPYEIRQKLVENVVCHAENVPMLQLLVTDNAISLCLFS
jgi:predicted transcriptional regulator